MKIMITGGSGFLGRGIMRYWPRQAEFVVYSRDEYKQDLCRQMYPGAMYILGDVKDYDRLYCAMRGCDIVIHTAALKYIPEAEYNVNECISVNILGSQQVLAAAIACEVETCIGISTDKAVLPINVYGMTKAIMERMWGEAAANYPDIHFGLVRYGNVIGSTGSVIEIFKRQLHINHKITITDPDMTRYWISIKEAVHLVELACEHGSGSIIIPKPYSMRLLDVAECIANEQAEIEIIGPRAGEKRHEQLIHQQESVRARNHNYYYELLLVGSPEQGEPFILSSNTPEAGWLDKDRMRDIIGEAECV